MLNLECKQFVFSCFLSFLLHLLNLFLFLKRQSITFKRKIKQTPYRNITDSRATSRALTDKQTESLLPPPTPKPSYRPSALKNKTKKKEEIKTKRKRKQNKRKRCRLFSHLSCCRHLIQPRPNTRLV